MQIHKITDVFFDLDHTLWDFETNSYFAYKSLFEKHNIPVDIDDFEKVYQPINKQFWDDYSKGLKDKETVKYGRISATFEVLNIELSGDVIHSLGDGYLDFLKIQTHLMPGSLEILDYLKGKYRLHILTNGFKEVQGDKMQHSGLVDYFDTLVSSEEVGKLKPHPDVFNFALQRTDTFAHNSFMIGDNLKSDVLGARNVGMHAIHYDPENTSDIDEKIIPRVQDLLDIKKYL